MNDSETVTLNVRNTKSKHKVLRKIKNTFIKIGIVSSPGWLAALVIGLYSITSPALASLGVACIAIYLFYLSFNADKLYEKVIVKYEVKIMDMIMYIGVFVSGLILFAIIQS